jgi:hypothetical protein
VKGTDAYVRYELLARGRPIVLGWAVHHVLFVALLGIFALSTVVWLFAAGLLVPRSSWLPAVLVGLSVVIWQLTHDASVVLLAFGAMVLVVALVKPEPRRQPDG